MISGNVSYQQYAVIMMSKDVGNVKSSADDTKYYRKTAQRFIVRQNVVQNRSSFPWVG